MSDKATVIESHQAAAVVGPYSPGLRAGPWLFLSGQLALETDGSLCTGDVAAQTTRIMENIAALLAAAGAGFPQLVKTTLYLVDMEDFALVNTVYARYLRPPYPARATVGVAALPKGARVEIEAVAWLPG